MLPERYGFTVEVKWYLRSYRAYFDVWSSLLAYTSEEPTFSRWKVQWAGICSLLKTSIHMLRHDAASYLPGPLKTSLEEAYHNLRRDKARYPLFWNFIDRERHNILKEYEFSAYEVFFKEDGTPTPYPRCYSQRILGKDFSSAGACMTVETLWSSLGRRRRGSKPTSERR